MKTIWNEAKISILLRANDRAVEKAMIAIYDNQTADEKSQSSTKHTNGRGFRANHASKGSYYARWVLSGKRLSGKHLENARIIALQYVRQLNEKANSKSSPDVTQSKKSSREERITAYMKQSGDSRENAERIEKNVSEGRCPDGCCGPEESDEIVKDLSAITSKLAERGYISGDATKAWTKRTHVKDGS
jgi:hypothetical protein